MPYNINANAIDWDLMLPENTMSEDYLIDELVNGQHNIDKLHKMIQHIATDIDNPQLTQQMVQEKLSLIQCYQLFQHLTALTEAKLTAISIVDNLILYQKDLPNTAPMGINQYQAASYPSKFINKIHKLTKNITNQLPKTISVKYNLKMLTKNLPKIKISRLYNSNQKNQTMPGRLIDLQSLQTLIQNKKYNPDIIINPTYWNMLLNNPDSQKKFLKNVYAKKQKNHHTLPLPKTNQYLSSGHNMQQWWYILTYVAQFLRNLQIKLMNQYYQNYIKRPPLKWIENLYQMELISPVEYRHLKRLKQKNPQLPMII